MMDGSLGRVGGEYFGDNVISDVYAFDQPGTQYRTDAGLTSRCPVVRQQLGLLS
jgi:hypothetical protein